MSKYKAHRPPEKWESNNPNKRGGSTGLPPGMSRPKQRQSRSKKGQNAQPPSDANFPMSDIWYPPSEAYFPPSEAPGPADASYSQDVTGLVQTDLQVQRMELPPNQPPVVNRAPKRLNAMTSDAASVALRRAIQSSPARWTGTQHSPIEVEDELGSTRRLLFPSPRKEGSPKVLGDLQSNIVHISPGSMSSKEQAVSVEAANKENCPPAVSAEDEDAEILALFEAEMARPSTPVHNEAAPSPFKTPTRPTPNHRPITRSVSRSIRTAKTPSQVLRCTPSKTPGSALLRRSPRHHHVFESPFTASMNQLMSEANNLSSPSHHFDMGIEFNLPDLPLMENTVQNGAFNGNYYPGDYLSTDFPMPSSPPKNFNLYEDPNLMADVDWNAFDQFDNQLQEAVRAEGAKEVQVKTEPMNEAEMDEAPAHPADANETELAEPTSEQTSSTLAGESVAKGDVPQPPQGRDGVVEQTPEEEEEDEVDMVRT